MCSVQFNPEACHLVAFGSANYRTYLYDLRYTSQATSVIQGVGGGKETVVSRGGAVCAWSVFRRHVNLWSVSPGGML